MDQLTLEIGRRPHPTPAGVQTATSLAIVDSTVSSIHARIQRASSGADLFVIQDLDSTNGTYVDGKRAHGPVPLRDGAVLFLGSQVLVLRIVTAAELDASREDGATTIGRLPRCVS